MSSDDSDVLDFGFSPEESQHHFLVTIPPLREDEKVYMSEHYEWEENDERRKLHFALGKEDNKVRVFLPRVKWNAIAEEVKSTFNRRLRDRGLPTGNWSTGENFVSRLFGKELVLLAWAIEDAELASVETAVKNWRGLAPEERWWLYTMTNAATGHAIRGRNKGWRKAVRYALTENPVSETNVEEREQMDFGLFRDQPA